MNFILLQKSEKENEQSKKNNKGMVFSERYVYLSEILLYCYL